MSDKEDISRRRVLEIGILAACVVLVVLVALSIFGGGLDSNSLNNDLDRAIDSANRSAERARLSN